MRAPGGWLRQSLGAKLLVAQMLVVVSGSLTLAVVALAVAPGVFHTHVRKALGTIPPRSPATWTRAWPGQCWSRWGLAPPSRWRPRSG
jgi:hypothetical protein